MIYLCTALDVGSASSGRLGSLRSAGVCVVGAPSGASAWASDPFAWRCEGCSTGQFSTAFAFEASDLASEPSEPEPEPDTGLCGLLDRLDGWLAELRTTRQLEDEALVLTSLVPGPDYAFLERAYGEAGRAAPFGEALLDLRSLAMGVLGAGWDQMAPHRLPAALGVRQPADQSHSMASEALLSAHVLVALLERLRRRIALGPAS